MRPDKNQYYLNIAKEVSTRSTCLRRRYGAVIVKNDEIISTGYNGACRGEDNCIDIGLCQRDELHIPKGERYELCRAVHAEQNAIISASRSEMIDSTIYIYGTNVSDNSIANSEPCKICKKFVKNAGISKIVCIGDNKEVECFILRENEYEICSL